MASGYSVYWQMAETFDACGGNEMGTSDCVAVLCRPRVSHPSGGHRALSRRMFISIPQGGRSRATERGPSKPAIADAAIFIRAR